MPAELSRASVATLPQESQPESPAIRLPRFCEKEIAYSDEQIMANLQTYYEQNLQDILSGNEKNDSRNRSSDGVAASQSSLYIFAYGSLIFRPDFVYAERIAVCVKGFRRRFGLWSPFYRGSMERPGLVLGLDCGGCCLGVAYKLLCAPSRGEPYKTLQKLWRREMFTEAYEPRLLRAYDKSGNILSPCLGFVLDRASSQYAGDVDERTRLHAISVARGTRGSNREYLLETQQGLSRASMRCSHIDSLAKKLTAVDG